MINIGRHAFVGLGFQDRGDSFDFNVALQEHFKWVSCDERAEKMTGSGVWKCIVINPFTHSHFIKPTVIRIIIVGI